MFSTFKPFETSAIECLIKGLSSDREKFLGNYFCMTPQALKMSLKCILVTFRVSNARIAVYQQGVQCTTSVSFSPKVFSEVFFLRAIKASA